MTHFGVHLPDPSSNPREFGELCRKVEEWGFNSVWLADALGRGGAEPMPALAYAAAQTRRLKLGTCIYVIPLRHPLVTAKLVATVDRLSGGRFILGVGVGWREDEFKAVGIPFQKRGKAADECLQIIRQAMERSKVEFEGEFFKIPGVGMGLRSAQKPRLPIWVGGNGRAAALRAAKFGDCWIPTDYTVDEHRKGRRLLARVCKQARRNPRDVKMASHLLVVISRQKSRAYTQAKSIAKSFGEKLEGFKQWAIVGDRVEVTRRIEAYNDAGVNYHVLNFGFKAPAQGIKLFAREVLPSFT